MKKLILALGLLLTLYGCEKSVNPQDGITMEPVDTVALGEICGGADKIKCQSGLECSEKNPTKSGVCQMMDKKDIECSKEQNPVCAQRGNNKNGYLNPCEADRHGAQILYEGLCKPDETVADNCKAKAISMGNCEAFFMGAEFNAKTGLCQEVGLSGCSADIPFNSVEDCQKSCGGKRKTKTAKLQFCPDEQINNLMPSTFPGPSNRSYYIYEGERREIDEFDTDWVEANCEVPTMDVH